MLFTGTQSIISQCIDKPFVNVVQVDVPEHMLG